MAKTSLVVLRLGTGTTKALVLCKCERQYHPHDPRSDRHEAYLPAGTPLPEGKPQAQVIEVVRESERDATRPSWCFDSAAVVHFHVNSTKPRGVGDADWAWLHET
jgi:hypothetical protein